MSLNVDGPNDEKIKLNWKRREEKRSREKRKSIRVFDQIWFANSFSIENVRVKETKRNKGRKEERERSEKKKNVKSNDQNNKEKFWFIKIYLKEKEKQSN